jgi:hypothetical protein
MFVNTFDGGWIVAAGHEHRHVANFSQPPGSQCQYVDTAKGPTTGALILPTQRCPAVDWGRLKTSAPLPTSRP